MSGPGARHQRERRAVIANDKYGGRSGTDHEEIQTAVKERFIVVGLLLTRPPRPAVGGRRPIAMSAVIRGLYTV